MKLNHVNLVSRYFYIIVCLFRLSFWLDHFVIVSQDRSLYRLFRLQNSARNRTPSTALHSPMSLASETPDISWYLLRNHSYYTRENFKLFGLRMWELHWESVKHSLVSVDDVTGLAGIWRIFGFCVCVWWQTVVIWVSLFPRSVYVCGGWAVDCGLVSGGPGGRGHSPSNVWKTNKQI